MTLSHLPYQHLFLFTTISFATSIQQQLCIAKYNRLKQEKKKKTKIYDILTILTDKIFFLLRMTNDIICIL